ncbi:hypothetical protein AB838_22075 [Rhodobacteraceae bacterium (ex Bugula neritina AB1)]|nr:hypothetical protein AB838_22075 [Rhodobacteraceae bacterium (ex Bugula neritina AB1)]
MQFLEQLKRISRIGAWFGGGLILLSSLITFVDVLLRETATISIGSTDEMSGFALAMSTGWAMSWCLFERGHIRIDTVYTFFPPRLQLVLDFVGLLLLLIFFSFVAWYSGLKMVEAFQADARTVSKLSLPIFFPVAVWLSGIVFFLICMVATLLSAARCALIGDIAKAHKITGVKEILEEIEEESVVEFQ